MGRRDFIVLPPRARLRVSADDSQMSIKDGSLTLAT
jgi:hypothetical protein